MVVEGIMAGNSRKKVAVCNKLGISFHVLDLRSEYRSHVIEHFRNEYLEGKTPNPCVICNRELKFGFLLEKAKNAGVDFDFFATGQNSFKSPGSGGNATPE